MRFDDLKAGETEINLANFPNGVYFVVMLCSGKMSLKCYNRECKETEKKQEFQLDCGTRQDICCVLKIAMKSKLPHVQLRGKKKEVVVHSKPPTAASVPVSTTNIWDGIDVSQLSDLDL